MEGLPLKWKHTRSMSWGSHLREGTEGLGGRVEPEHEAMQEENAERKNPGIPEGH